MAKKLLHLTIDPEVYRLLKERVTNISKFFETIARDILKQTQPSYITISSTPTTPAIPEIPPAPKLKPVEKVEPIEEVKGLPPAKDLKELYEKLKTEFEAYLLKKVSEKTAIDYISAMDRHLIEGITKPSDLDKIEKKTKPLGKGLRNLLNFLKEVYEVETLFGKDIEKHWRPKIWLEAQEEKIKYYPETEEIKAFYELLVKYKAEEDTMTLFKLLAYSGIRLEHGIRLLGTFDKNLLVFPKNFPKVAMYDTAKLGTDIKQSYVALMPSEFAKKLKRFDFGDLDNAEVMEKVSKRFANRLNARRWKRLTEEELERVFKVSAIGIRTWFQNFLVTKRIPDRIRDFIVGHEVEGIEKEYLEFRQRAFEFYNEIVDELVEIVPP